MTSASARRVLRKAWVPMVVRLSGKVADAKEVAPSKARSPIEMRLSGSTMETKETHSRKAAKPMKVTPSGTTAWPFGSGVYRQPAATPPSASRTKIVTGITGRGMGRSGCCPGVVWVRESS